MLSHIGSARKKDRVRIRNRYQLAREFAYEFNLAVSEAEAAAELTPEERIRLLTFRYYSVKYNKFYE